MPRKAYECSMCNAIHDHEHQAEDCCRPEVNKVWLCDVCDEPHDDSECAEKCCVEKIKARSVETVRCPACCREQELILHAAEIEVAGHCSECNPHYSIEHAFVIADLVEQRIAEKRP